MKQWMVCFTGATKYNHNLNSSLLFLCRSNLFKSAQKIVKFNVFHKLNKVDFKKSDAQRPGHRIN